VACEVCRRATAREILEKDKEALNCDLSEALFDLGEPQKYRGLFLFRRKQLKDFIKERHQAAAILEFLEQSHEKLWPVVPKIHEHYRQEASPGVSWLPPTHSPILPSS
jgi:hypothetical protein